jgi:fructose-bisphosphate aldolase class II
MLMKISEMLSSAKEGHYGVPAILACNLLSVQATVKAAEDSNSPLIMLCGGGQTKDLDYLGRVMNDYANKATVPVCMILDHSPNFEDSLRGIHAGFNTIMVDRSTLPFEENVAQVKELARIAHAAGVEVEGELGHVGMGDNYAVDGYSAFTVPDEAVRYVEETGVDCLAVAIGTAHGVYKGTPELHFDLLQELRDKVPVPLVLHGGSGSGDDNLSKACRQGICKVNIANDVLRAADNKLVENGMEGNNIYQVFDLMFEGYYEKSCYLMKLFGSAGNGGR